MAYVAATAVLASALSLLAALFAGGEACNNVATMTWTEACRRTDRWENLCLQVLQGAAAPDAAEATVYALIATRFARFRLEDSLSEVDALLRRQPGGNAPGEARAALDNCKVKLGSSRRLLAAVADQLFACDFSAARQEYLDAEVGARSCQDGLLRLPGQYQSWPLFKRVSDDHELTIVAYLLGAIFLGR